MIKMGMMQSGPGNSFPSSHLIKHSKDVLYNALVRPTGLKVWIEGFLGKVIYREKRVLRMFCNIKSIFVRVI